MWFWHEGEHYVKLSCPSGAEKSNAASGGYYLGGLGATPNDYVEYEIETPTDMDANLYIRYAKASGRAIFDLFIDGKLVGRSPSLLFEATGGDGKKSEDWQFKHVYLRTLRGGKHTIKLQSKYAQNELNIDGIFLGDENFHLPDDFDAFGLSILENEIEQTRAMKTKVNLIQTERQPRKLARMDYRPVLELIQNPPAALAKLFAESALSEESSLLCNIEPGKSPNYDKQLVWHLLRKEKNLDIPKPGNLGVINPNSDIVYMLGVQMQADELRFQVFSDPILHFDNLWVEKIRVIDGLDATAIFIPYEDDTLMTAVIVENSTNDTKYFNLYQMCYKEPVEGKPEQKYGKGILNSTGKMILAGYNNNNDALIACYDEWVSGQTDRKVAKLMTAMTSTERPSGHILKNEMTGSISVMHPIKYAGLKYRVTIKSGAKQLILFGFSACPYSNYALPEAALAQKYPQMTDDEAIKTAIRKARNPFESDWQGRVIAAIEAAKSYKEAKEAAAKQQAKSKSQSQETK